MAFIAAQSAYGGRLSGAIYRTMEGTILLGNCQRRGEFEVFDSKGSWSFLFGKPLLQAFEAVHDYKSDVIRIPGNNSCDTLINKSAPPQSVAKHTDYEWEAFNWEKRATLVGGLIPPLREVHHFAQDETSPTKADAHTSSLDKNDPHTVCHVTENSEDLEFDEGAEVHVDHLEGGNNPSIFSRASAPFKPERIAKILREVQIGPDLSVAERERVEALITHFADCFALSVSEVLPIPDAIHQLNIPPDHKFPKQVHQRRLTPPQREYLNGKIDEMLNANIIETCDPGEVKCVSPTTLAQKVHGTADSTVMNYFIALTTNALPQV